MSEQELIEIYNELKEEVTKQISAEIEDELTKNITKKIERIFQKVLENYVFNPDIHNLAYSINNEYRLFFDNLPDDIKIKQRKLKPWFIAKKITDAPYHIATLGLTKLLQKSPKKIVNSKEFTETMQLLNTIFKNY